MGIISTQAFTFRLVANGTQLDIFDDDSTLFVTKGKNKYLHKI